MRVVTARDYPGTWHRQLESYSLHHFKTYKVWSSYLILPVSLSVWSQTGMPDLDTIRLTHSSPREIYFWRFVA